MTKGFYGQSDEDKILFRVFENIQNGYYAEMGASDGVKLSNSYFFEKLGWSGICIEPYKPFFEELIKNRPNSICINCAVGDENKETVLHVPGSGYNATCALDEMLAVRERLHRVNYKKSEYNPTLVVMRRLEDIFDENNVPLELEFISIDVEGSEIDVLKGLNLEKYKPKVLLIETNDRIERSKINEFLQPFEYFSSFETKCNTFYYRDILIHNKLMGKRNV